MIKKDKSNRQTIIELKIINKMKMILTQNLERKKKLTRNLDRKKKIYSKKG